MAHEFESGFFVSQAPWHGLGTILDKPPTTARAILEAGLDWNVLEKPVFIEDREEIGNYKALVRESDRSVLGIVSNSYQPLQNREAFGWFDFLLHEGDVTLEAAGSLKNGKRIWILAKLPQQIADVGADDPVTAYLLLHNSHDGSTAIILQFTPIRVVCWNTLSFALSSFDRDRKSQKAIRIRHGSSATSNLAAAQNYINVTKRQFGETIEQYRAIASKDIDRQLLETYVSNTFNRPATELRSWERIVANFETGRGNRGRNLWDAYNAVTELICHQRGRNSSTRLESAWFGEGEKVRDRAHREALALLR